MDEEKLLKYKEEEPETKASIFAIPKRYILCFLIFSGFVIMNSQRSCLSVAIVAMTSKEHKSVAGRHIIKEAEFHWNSRLKGVILGSFFYGYIVLQIPGGWLALKLGAKRVMGIAILIASITSMLIPIIVRHNVTLFIAARVVQGLALGVTIPTNLVIWGKWAPEEERSTLMSFTVAGLSAGMLVAMPTSGFLAVYGFAGGWPSVFYTFGIAGIIWFICWQIFVYDSPESHPTITEQEKQLIMLTSNKSDQSSEKRKVPWCKIFKSVPVWAIICAHFSFDCSYYTLLVCMPLFLRDVHHFNIETTGILSSIPWLCMSLMTLIAGFTSDFLIKRMRSSIVRKLTYGGGMVVSGSMIVGSTYTTESYLTVVLMCIAIGFFGFSFTGFMVNPLDIAPRYAGIIIGFSNCISTMPGFLGPTLVGIATKSEGSHGWKMVFWGMGIISSIGTILFLLMGSGDLQSWATNPEYELLNDFKIESHLTKDEAPAIQKEAIDNK